MNLLDLLISLDDLLLVRCQDELCVDSTRELTMPEIVGLCAYGQLLLSMLPKLSPAKLRAVSRYTGRRFRRLFRLAGGSHAN